MKKYFKLGALAGALLLAPASALLAGERLTESFSNPQGGLPEGWKAAKVSQVSVAEIRSAPGGGDALLIQRTPEGVGSASVFYTGGGAGAPEASIGDLNASVNIRMEQPAKSTSCSHGILLRASKMSYKGSEGFYVAIHPLGPETGLGIYWAPETHVLNGERLAFAPISNLAPNTEYVLQVKAKGNTIEGQLWSVDSAGAKKDLLGEVRTDEATQATEGHFALRNGIGNSGPIGTWYKALHLSTGE